TLVIPIVGRFYFVQRGDTLYAIAQRFNISVQELAQINAMSSQYTLPVGIRIYIPPQTTSPITANAYIEPTSATVSDTLENAARKNSCYLTYLAPFSYKVNRDGSLTPPPLNQLASIAHTNNTSLMLTVTNLDGGQFSTELGHIILTVQAMQNTLLYEVVNTAHKIGYTDVHFDFEYLPPEDRDAYNHLLRRDKERLSQDRLFMSTALAPKTSATQSGTL